MKLKAVFLDRDGTINREVEYLHRVEDFEFEPGSVEALKLLAGRGVDIYVITNQSGIARGRYTEEDYQKVTRHMAEELGKEGVSFAGIFHCPHHPEGSVPEYAVKCACRKPATGMLEPVVREKGYRPEEAALVGDKNVDIEAGKKMGFSTVLVRTGYGKEMEPGTDADFVEDNLLEAVKRLLKV